VTASDIFRGPARTALALALLVASASALFAQQPDLPPYRAPVLALVQPPAGTGLPQDRPVVVLRFAQGEPNDPIDVGSFAIAVDGQDRTRQFQVTASEAWGPLAPAEASASPIEAGPHQLAARICSARGACTELSATVSVVPPAVVGADEDGPPDARRRRLLAALLDALRKILTP
jgi:hypothetical protein